jgi:XrtJ-associated TM-motif-TM protein
MLRKSVVVAAVLVLVSPLLHAQGGCVDSPENPTAILAMVGAAGAVLARLRMRR